MSERTRVQNQESVNRFWHNYLFLLEKNSIPAKVRPWYRKHIEEYINAHPGIKLQQHQPQQIDEYLTAKGRMPNLPEWRFRQIADALRLLYQKMLRPGWADEYDWYRWRAYSRELEPEHPTLMRDGNPSLLVAQSNNALIRTFREEHEALHQAFVKTIRVRGMAAQTEKTYEHWLVRRLAGMSRGFSRTPVPGSPVDCRRYCRARKSDYCWTG